MSSNVKHLIDKLSATSRQALELAANLARARTHFEVDFEHVLRALIDESSNDAVSIFRAYDIDIDDLRQQLDDDLTSLKAGNNRNPVLSENLSAWLEKSWLIASIDFNHHALRTGVLLLGLRSSDAFMRRLGRAAAPLRRLPVDDLREQLPSIMQLSREKAGERSSNSGPDFCDDITIKNSGCDSPTLDKYTVDLTAQARAGKIDSILGRDREIRQMIDILLRRRQNNPILTGEPGVGKTAVVEGLATQIASGAVPPPLQHVSLRTLDLGLLQAGASVKGEFENRLRAVIDEVKASATPIILFIDEAHTMIGAGGAAGQNDAANLLKPALARGELRTIAATTWAEYKKYFEKDAALARRFQVVKVDEPDIDTAIHMLRGVVPALEQHHGVRILDQAVVDAVKLSARYLTGRQLPDKCVAVLDTACARVALSLAGESAPLVDVSQLLDNLAREESAIQRDVISVTAQQRLNEIAAKRNQLLRLQDDLRTDYEIQKALALEVRELRQDASKQSLLNATITKLQQRHRDRALVYECVDAAIVAEVISGWTGIPLGRMLDDEFAAVQHLVSLLGQRIIGQNQALSEISQRIQISRAGLEDPCKPKGVLLLVGPSGVGKTETALALADILYGGERNLITINMSEFQESHSVAGLKGSPPGYVGYGEGGVLTEAVRRKPYSVVLLDEVEKAHPDVLELFFQVFDKGRLEDSEGNEVDFRNTVIILTSNVGTELIMAATEHGVKADDTSRPPTPADLTDLLRDELQTCFRPAFLGRLSVIPYYPVRDDVLRGIIALKLDRIRQRIQANQGANLLYSDDLIDLIAQRCIDIDSGARNADAVINEVVLAPVSIDILNAMAERRTIEAVELSADSGSLRVVLRREDASE
jgi:type VI secretion system protein VasG